MPLPDQLITIPKSCCNWILNMLLQTIINMQPSSLRIQHSCVEGHWELDTTVTSLKNSWQVNISNPKQVYCTLEAKAAILKLNLKVLMVNRTFQSSKFEHDEKMGAIVCSDLSP